jgi:precorrin-6A synthase
LFVIGIGAGDPEHVTVQAVRALNQVDVFFLVDKGDVNEELLALRREICERYIEPGRAYRFVEVADPARDRTADAYTAAVEAWRDARTDLYEGLVADLPDGEVGAFLVWGDPSLYDGTLLVLDEIARRGRVEFEHEVIPGISAVSALAARHRVPLNRPGEAIQITTGRRLRAGLPDGVDNVVVMLDGGQAYLDIEDDVDVYWGAFVGTDDELLVSGDLQGTKAEIERVRASAKARKGWMFDTYLLRRRLPS